VLFYSILLFEDAWNNKPEIHQCQTGKRYIRVQEYKAETAQDDSSHLVQQLTSNRTRLEATSDPTPHGDQRLHVQ
jgi:hypothetical protein